MKIKLKSSPKRTIDTEDYKDVKSSSKMMSRKLKEFDVKTGKEKEVTNKYRSNTLILYRKDGGTDYVTYADADTMKAETKTIRRNIKK